jgi:hypothetical protein
MTSAPAAGTANGWMRWLPGLQILRRYEAAWLPHDLIAGLVLTTMLVPVGIAYAVASGVPGINGLYATIFPLLAYALFGPSRILVLGPDSSLAPVILAVVLPLSGGDPARAVAIASMMAVVSGLVCILVGLVRLGFVTELLSKPIRYGYMNGIALTVLISQLPKLFGFSIESSGPLRDVVRIAEAVLGGEVNWVTFAIGAGTLVTILALKPFKRIPGILIAVVGATLVVGALGLEHTAGVKVLGPLPQGLPSFTVPWISLADLGQVVIGGCAVAMVAFADTSVLSRTYAARTRSQVDPNQEMVGLGAANLAAGLFQGFPISSSSSRTPVAEAAGAKTQLTGVVGAVAVALLLLLAPNLLSNLPSSALAAVVIAAARPVRIQRPATHLPHPALGILVVDSLLRRCRRTRSDTRHRPGDSDRGDRVPVGRLAAALRRARPRRRDPRISRPQALPAGATHTGAGAVPLGRASFLRQRGVVSPARAGSGRELAQAGEADYRGRRTGDQHRRDFSRHARGARAVLAGIGNRTALRRNEGSGQGQVETLRGARVLQCREFLSHRGRRHRRLP